MTSFFIVALLRILLAVLCMKYFVVYCNGVLFCDRDVLFSSYGVLWQSK